MKLVLGKRISVFLALPASIKKKILLHYKNRITFTESTASEIIWTSFYYFALTQPVRVKENEDGYAIRFSYANKKLNLLVRRGESSDIYVFFQVFIRNEYLPLFNQLRMRGETPTTCLDAGANIGCFTIAMLCWFPDCKIFSVEPDRENYNVLLKNLNLNNLSNLVVPIHAALWVKNTKLFLKKTSVQEWAYAVTEDITPDGECSALTLSTILQRYSAAEFYICKIDVEGAEQQLFEDADFIQGIQVSKIIGLEIHNDKADRKKIQDTLHRLGYALTQHGELTLARKI